MGFCFSIALLLLSPGVNAEKSYRTDPLLDPMERKKFVQF